MKNPEQKYTLLVADDEAMVRQFVRFVVNNKLPKIEIVGEAADGDQMLKEALKHRPHILLTDIRMPKKDGLKAARAVVQALPQTQVVFLTAYEQFDYAKEALNLKAEEYLVKPIRPDDLTEVLQRCITKIQERDLYTSMLVTMNSLFTESRNYLKAHFCEELLQGRLSQEQRYFKLAALAGYEDIPDLIVVVEIDDTDLKDRSFLLASAAQVETILTEQELSQGSRPFVYHQKPGVYTCFLKTNASSEDTAVAQAKKWAHSIHAAISMRVGTSVTIGIGSWAPEFTGLPASYRAAMAAKSFRFIKGPGQIFSLLDLNYQENPNILPLLPLQAQLAEAVELGNPKLMQEVVTKVITELFTLAEISPPKARQAILDTVQIAVAAAQEGGLDIEQVAGCLAKYEKQVNIATSFKQMAEPLVSVVDCLVQLVAKNQISLSAETVYQAMAFIRNNYQENLTLNKVAGAVYLSPYYFSRLFKRTTGMNFTCYLTQVRINAAKELLKQNTLTVKEVAQAVGYADPRYFSSVFKKMVGVSPGDYS